MLPLSLAGVVASARTALGSNGVAVAASAADLMNFRRVMVKILPRIARICTNFQSVSQSGQLHRNFLVQNFAHGQGDDDFSGAFEKFINLCPCVAGKIEADKKSLVAVFTHHHGLK